MVNVGRYAASHMDPMGKQSFTPDTASEKKITHPKGSLPDHQFAETFATC